MASFHRIYFFFTLLELLVHRGGAQGRLRRDQATKRTGRILSIEDFGAIADVKKERWSFREFEDTTTDDVEQHRHEGTNREADEQDELDDTILAIKNAKAFDMALLAAQPGDTVLVPDGKTFTSTGGILANQKHDIVLDFAGSLHFASNRRIWTSNNVPESTLHVNEGFDPAIALYNCTDVTLTSSSTRLAKVKVDYNRNTINLVNSKEYSGGIINGNGRKWWDDTITGKHTEHRPRLLHIMESANILVEKLTLLNSPFWTLTIECIDSEVRHVNVLVDRKYSPSMSAESASLEMERSLKEVNIPIPIPDLPDWIGRKFHQPQDLNTDGIDPIGENIWIHDCIIQNADDSVAVKPSHGGRRSSRIPDCTRNIKIENMILTGFGASIGSVPPHPNHRCIDGVTFRNISMPGTGKGIYIKSDWGDNDCHNETGQITNILYEDIRLDKPFWWPVWLGPQQQHQPNSKLHKKCALTWPVERHCPVPGCIEMENITLRNIQIQSPLISPAVLLGNKTNPMRNILIENLHVSESKSKIWHGKWPFHENHYPYHGRIKCVNAQGSFKNSHPEPTCLAKT